MKSFLTLPKDKTFFDIYAKFAAGIALGVLVAQIISGLTESGIIYQAIYNSLLVFGPAWAIWGAVAGAFLGVALIELVGLRFFLPMAVDSFLYKRWRGLHAVISLFCLLMTGVLITGSYFLSMEGKSDLVEGLFQESKAQSQGQIDSTYQVYQEQQRSQFQSDSLTLAQNHQTLVESETQRFRDEKAVHEKQLTFWRAKQSRTGRNYETRISNAELALNQAKARHSAKLVALNTDRNQTLGQLNQRKTNQADSLQQAHIVALDSSNTQLSTKENRYAKGSGWIVIIAVSFSIIGIILQRVFRKGSGIEEKPLPTDYYFRESIWADAWHVLTERFQQVARQRIANFHHKTKQPPIPTISVGQYDLTEFQQEPIQVKLSETEGQGAQVIYLNNDNRIDENRKSAKLRNCEHCGVEYVYKHHKQKYCSDACRVAAWEIKTGRKMKKVKKGK